MTNSKQKLTQKQKFLLSYIEKAAEAYIKYNVDMGEYLQNISTVYDFIIEDKLDELDKIKSKEKT